MSSASATETSPRRITAGVWCASTATAYPHILDAVMQLFPLDTFVEKPVYVMEVVDKDQSPPPIWKEYAEIIRRYEPNWTDFQQVERFAFYEQAKSAYAVVATGEGALYANLILKKGVIT